jgi:hypothetical protein
VLPRAESREPRVEYRASSSGRILELTWDEFHVMIRRGEVAPKSLVRARVITADDWWTADNLCVFHRESPVKHPLGHHLTAELERGRLEAERHARIDEAVRPYYDACDQPWMVEDCYGVTPLEVVVSGPAVVGASRLTISASFAPEYVVTCAFRSREVEVEAVTGSMDARTALWFQWFRPELVPDLEYLPPTEVPVLEIRRATRVFPSDRVPAAFSSWDLFADLARAAWDCDNQALDGVSFTHDVRGCEVRLRAKWSNPERETDPHQFALVAAYRDVLAATGLVKHSRVL